jgi:hypothetical protein
MAESWSNCEMWKSCLPTQKMQWCTLRNAAPGKATSGQGGAGQQLNAVYAFAGYRGKAYALIESHGRHQLQSHKEVVLVPKIHDVTDANFKASLLATI